MANIKFSAILSDVRGKLNGSIFSRNHYGPVIKTTFTPSNPQSTPQMTERNKVSELAAHWRELSQSQRNAWYLLADELIKKNSVGEKKAPAGYNLFISHNLNLFNCAASEIDDANSDSFVDTFDYFYLTYSAPPTFNINANFPGFTTTLQGIYIIYATPSLSLGIRYVNCQFRKIGVIPAGRVDFYSFSSAYYNVFGFPVSGMRIFVRLRPINSYSGFSGGILQNYIDIP